MILGLIFEKINGYKDGSYYTPTEITDYMAKYAIEQTILAKVKNQFHLDYSDFSEFKAQFPHFSEEERNGIKNIIRTLTVVDPAVGSGHFLVSTLNVLLSLWFEFAMIDIPRKYELKVENGDVQMYENGELFSYRRNDPESMEFQKAIFQAKKEIIENNLFGVDINKKSVEIARLRLWIELLKNAYYKDDGTMETLPNIDINIKEGDSLLASMPALDFDIFSSGKDIPDYKRIWKQYQNASDKSTKKEIVEQLMQKRAELKKKIVGGNDQYNDFIWTIDFPQILNDDGDFKGFDIAIGNPPYIQLQKNKGKLADLYSDMHYETLKRTGDIYCLFYERGLKLLQPNGVLCYITSNKWMRADYGEKLREFFLKYNPLLLINLGPSIFEEATVDTNILVVAKSANENKLKGYSLTEEGLDNLEDLVKKNAMKLDKPGTGPWFIGSDAVQQLKQKIEQIGKPLKNWDIHINYGIKTGLNKAFIIDTATKTKILADCKDENERKKTEEIIKPILRGRDIEKYFYKWAELWVIFIPWHFPLQKNKNIQGSSKEAEKEFQKQFPAIYGHLLQYKDELLKRNKDEIEIRYEWYAMQRCANTYYTEFEKEKIVWGGFSSNASFSFVEKGMFVNAPANILISNNGYTKFLCGIMNSKIFDWEFKQVGIFLGQAFEWGKQSVEKIPIPPVTSQNQPLVSQIESLVDQILLKKQSTDDSDTSGLEQQIDQLVYQLYDLTPNEIALVESSVNH
jgi:type II restriction/modification system DNA methylase subunit YeeA